MGVVARRSRRRASGTLTLTMPGSSGGGSSAPDGSAPVSAQAAGWAAALAGAGATPQIAHAVGARLLTGDPVTEAENIQWPR